MQRTLVVGLGSAHGDDQAGWKVVQRLGPNPCPGTETVALGDPSQLLDHLEGCSKLILVDASRSGKAPGTISRLTWPDAAVAAGTGRSSHGFSAGAVLMLADRLGWLPRTVILFGIEAEILGPDQDVSPAVASALPRLCEQVLEEVPFSWRTSIMIEPELLGTVRFLEGIAPDDLSQIAGIAEVQEMSAGGVVFREGMKSQHVYLVLEGRVALEIRVPGRGAVSIQTVSTGELLGWSPMLETSPMTATARAVNSTRLLVLHAPQLVALGEHNPRLGLELMRRTALALAQRLNATRLQLLDVYRHELPVVPEEGGPG